jgi:hypothetical protein
MAQFSRKTNLPLHNGMQFALVFWHVSAWYLDTQTAPNCQRHDGKDHALSVEPVSAFAGWFRSQTMNLVFCSLEWGSSALLAWVIDRWRHHADVVEWDMELSTGVYKCEVWLAVEWYWLRWNGYMRKAHTLLAKYCSSKWRLAGQGT